MAKQYSKGDSNCTYGWACDQRYGLILESWRLLRGRECHMLLLEH